MENCLRKRKKSTYCKYVPAYYNGRDSITQVKFLPFSWKNAENAPFLAVQFRKKCCLRRKSKEAADKPLPPQCCKPRHNLHSLGRWVASNVLYCFQHPAAKCSREACKPRVDPASRITKCGLKKDLPQPRRAWFQKRRGERITPHPP